MKTCIIIGAGGGVSEAVARRFGSSGYRIGLVARNPNHLQALCERLSDAGISTIWEAADAGIAEALDTALDDLLTQLGRCDVLIYNAAVLRPAGPLDLEREDLAAEMAVNVLGAHLAVRKSAPGMIARKAGAILFTGGGLAFEPFPEWTSLAMGKAALRSLAISLFKHLSPSGIHVSVIAICGIVEAGGPFDPARIAEEYWRVATAPDGVRDREVIFQPEGTDMFYNDPERKHAETSRVPDHMRQPTDPC